MYLQFENRATAPSQKAAQHKPTQQTWAPPAQVFEQPDAYTIVIALPGVAKDEVSVKVENNLLTISAPASVLQENGKWQRREFGIWPLERSFKLPPTANSAAITAQSELGLLHIRIPKNEAATARKINIV